MHRLNLSPDPQMRLTILLAGIAAALGLILVYRLALDYRVPVCLVTLRAAVTCPLLD